MTGVAWIGNGHRAFRWLAVAGRARASAASWGHGNRAAAV